MRSTVVWRPAFASHTMVESATNGSIDALSVVLQYAFVVWAFINGTELYLT